MEQVHVREANGEVLVYLDKHVGDPLIAKIDAYKVLGREVLREIARLDGSDPRKAYYHKLSRSSESNG